jgi:glycylpeptide N-tetradecanoyltransferase
MSPCIALTSRALTAPGYLPEWHIGVRVVKTGKLVAFISGIKVDLRVRQR